MKKLNLLLMVLMVFGMGQMFAQKEENFISCSVDGKEYKAEAKRLRIGGFGFDYLTLAAFQVNPDVQVWIRIFYFKDELKPGTYNIVSEEQLTYDTRKKKIENDSVWVLVDYTEETKKLGYGYHDGESMTGSLTIEEVTDNSIKGTFEANLKGVYYKKRNVAAVTGSGIRGNIEQKMLTKAGAGILVTGGPHDHDNTKKLKETDSIVLTNGSFFVDWSKPEKTKDKE